MRYIAFVVFFFGCVFGYAQPVNDLMENALEIPHTSLWNSADAAYTLDGSTPDGPAKHPAFGGPWHNVWFKFQATTAEAEFRLLRGGSKGTMTSSVLTLVDEEGNVHSSMHASYVRSVYLEPEEWYYVSVDSWESYGTFSIEMVDHVTNDMAAKALEVPHTAQWSSGNAAYSNIGATGGTFEDQPGSFQRNVWFKFRATTTDVDIRLMTGDAKGTLSGAVMVLFDQEGNMFPDKRSTYLQNVGLTVGEWYYLSVDGDTGLEGTFTLSVSSVVGFDNAARALELDHVAFWQSADAYYSNVNATGDFFNNTPWGGLHNVWFTFTATTAELDMRFLTGDSKGTFAGPIMVLWDDAGNALSDRRSDYLQSIALTPGERYYVSVDTHASTSVGTFTISMSNKMGYDMRAKAELLRSIGSWISADAAYTTVNATGDDFNNGPWGAIRNVWFTFKATTTDINIEILYGGTKGTLTGALTKLYDDKGVLLLSGYEKLRSVSLTPGSVYYFSVDDNGGKAGSFAVKVGDHIGYDMKAGAEVIQHAAGWCTDNAYYSTVNATADEVNSSTCGAFRNNVWFKFQATGATITMKLSTGGDHGTLSSPAIYLLDKSGAVLSCKTSTGYETAEITYTSLTKGEWYHFVADSHSGGMGTFTLCIDGGSGSEMNSFCKDIFCDGKGGMGINTSIIPEGYKLSVRGKIISEGVKVELQSKWPDYVFDLNYVLPDLSEVKRYIEQNHHLPEVPSAASIEQGGIDLGSMDAILLKKVEELTLHLIRMEERLKAVEAENKVLRQNKR